MGILINEDFYKLNKVVQLTLYVMLVGFRGHIVEKGEKAQGKAENLRFEVPVRPIKDKHEQSPHAVIA